MFIQHIDSPVGPLRIGATATAITEIAFAAPNNAPGKPPQDNPSALTALAGEQLAAYFAGTRSDFSLPLAPTGTAFQQRVWRQLRTIPYGDTCSYAAIAAAINNSRAVRAVGAANGRNPIAIVVPCHRVIGANGTLTGYAGGLDRKAWLLQHEQRQGRLQDR